MKTSEARGRHLTPDEIIARVFPVDEGASPVPMHLAVCPECQSKVARLREGFLLDRGALVGGVEAYPDAFWSVQSAAIMDTVASVDRVAPETNVRPFPLSFRGSFLRRPEIAVGSIAAALILVAGLSILKPGHSRISDARRPTVAPALQPAETTGDRSDDQLLRDIDHLLDQDAPYAALVPEGVS